ncbi:MAG: sodium/substrate symporter small subunit, partial [Pseudomonadota bacterium]
MSEDDRPASGYWAANIRLVAVLLLIWALVSFGNLNHYLLCRDPSG